MNIKYKEAGNGEFVTIFLDESEKEASRTPSWNKKNKPGYYKEMMAWVEAGNTIEPQFTVAELAEKENKEKTNAYDYFISQRNERLIEADKWELQSIQKRYNITQEQVEEYKQFLCDMPNTLTVESSLEELKNPDWPTKLIEGLL